MVDHDDVWKPAGSAARSAAPDLPPAVAEGIPLRQALSVGTVLSNGWAVLRERPLALLQADGD